MAEYTPGYKSSSCDAKTIDNQTAETSATLYMFAGNITSIPQWANTTECSDEYQVDDCTYQDVTLAPSYDYPAPYNDGQPHTLTMYISCDPTADCPNGDTFQMLYAWQTATDYRGGGTSNNCLVDVTVVDNVEYYCTTDHTSSSTTQPGTGVDWEDYWNVFGAGSSVTSDCSRGLLWQGAWTTSTDYEAVDEGDGDPCNSHMVQHVLSTGDPDWADATAYVVGDKRYSSNVLYLCINDHTSASATEPGTGVDWEDEWELYDVTLLPYGTFICILSHTSDSTNEPVWGVNKNIYWELMVSGQGGALSSAGGYMVRRGEWTDTETYNQYDTVQHEGSSYICTDAHVAKKKSDGVEGSLANEPSLLLLDPNAGILDKVKKALSQVQYIGPNDFNDPSPYWELLSKGANEKGFLGGAFDWLEDVTGWDVPDWLAPALGILGVGAGAYALARYLDTDDPEQYEARFNGDTGYISSFTNPALDTTVAAICTAAGLTNYDVDDLPSTPVSFAVNSTNYRSLLETLSQAYQFDIVSTFDNGRTLKFKPRSVTPVDTIALSDLGWKTGTSGDAPYQGKRLQGTDLPRSVELSYYSQEFSEKRLTQSSVMRTYPQGQQFKLDLPLSLDDSVARDLCDVVLMNAHLERSQYSFTTSLNYLHIEAADVVTIPGLGNVRITSVRTSDQNDALLQFTAVDAGVATSTSGSITGTAGTGPQPVTPDSQETVNYLTTTQVIPLDLPPLDNLDRSPRLHLALYGLTASNWNGANVYLSRDNSNFIQVANTILPSSWGYVETAISSAPNIDLIDETTTITVEMKQGTLTSASSDLAFFNGENKCMVGQELIYFKTVNDLGSGVYELTHLLRGRRGTDAYHDLHEDDELLVIINENLLELPIKQDDFNKPLYLKVQTVGLDVADATAITLSPQFHNFRGWKVTNEAIGLDATTNAFVGTWVRRYKWDADLVNGRSNYADEDLAGYKVAILDPSDDSVVRTFVVQAPEFVYTSAQQVADFGSNRTQLKVSVVPMSKTIGPGHPSILTYGI